MQEVELGTLQADMEMLSDAQSLLSQRMRSCQELRHRLQHVSFS